MRRQVGEIHELGSTGERGRKEGRKEVEWSGGQTNRNLYIFNKNLSLQYE